MRMTGVLNNSLCFKEFQIMSLDETHCLFIPRTICQHSVFSETYLFQINNL